MSDQTLTPEGAQDFAERSFKGAMMALFHTFNLGDCPDVPYSFDRATRDEATEHCRALMAIFFNRSKLTPRLGAIAQGDGDFQRFMQTATSEPTKRRKARPTD